MSAGKPPPRVTLELDTDREAIRGTLEHDNGQREQFWGWLELMAALPRVTASRLTAAATTSRSPETTRTRRVEHRAISPPRALGTEAVA
jgi:hypothetical protein